MPWWGMRAHENMIKNLSVGSGWQPLGPVPKRLFPRAGCLPVLRVMVWDLILTRDWLLDASEATPRPLAWDPLDCPPQRCPPPQPVPQAPLASACICGPQPGPPWGTAHNWFRGSDLIIVSFFRSLNLRVECFSLLHVSFFYHNSPHLPPLLPAT